MNENKKDRWIDQTLNSTVTVKGYGIKAIDVMFIICLWGFGLFIRLKLFPLVSADYSGFLEPWMEQIQSLGAWKSLGVEISNYPVAYMYLMSLVSGASDTMVALKMISVVFDYAASVAMFLLVLNRTESIRKAILGMAIVILCPTVIIDGAYWCQCDIIYACFILFALYFFFKDKDIICMLFLGLAFSFKLQTVFVLPFFIIMWLKKKTVRAGSFLLIPGVYVLMQIPAIIAGRSIKDLLLFYFGQADYYPWGTLEYPNLYVFLDETIDRNHHMNEISSAGILFCIIFLGFLAYYFYTSKIKLTDNICISILLFTVASVVFLLPHMHDRYGFLIDVIAIIYVILRPRKMPIMAGFMLISLINYMKYLIGERVVSMPFLAIGQFALIVYVGFDLYKQISEQNCNSDTEVVS